MWRLHFHLCSVKRLTIVSSLSFGVTWGETGQTFVLGPETYYKTETPPRNLSQLKNEALGINYAKNIHPLLSRIPNDIGHWKPSPLTHKENSTLLKMDLMPQSSVETQKILTELWPSIERLAFVWWYLVKHFSSKLKTCKIGQSWKV